MNILIVEKHLCPTRGGVERVSYTIGEGLRLRGHMVYYTYTKLDDNCVPLEHKVRLPIEVSEKTYDILSDFVKNRNIEILLCQNLAWGMYFGIYQRLKQKFGVKIISVLHSNPDIWVNKNRWGCTYSNIYFKELLRSVKHKLCGNPYKYNMMKQYELSDIYVLLSPNFIPVFRNLYGVVGEKLRAISNPCAFSEEKVHVTIKENMILVVSRMAEQQKRISNVLLIWQKIQSRHPNWRIVLLGSGPDIELYKRKAIQMRLERIQFMGAYNHPEDFYNKAKIFLMTSSWEGFGMTLIEAQHYGCVPFVYDSYAAVYDIISNGENGIIIPHHDIKRYCEELHKLMSNNIEWQKMSVNAMTMNKNKFSLNTILNQWELLFKELKEWEQ